MNSSVKSNYTMPMNSLMNLRAIAEKLISNIGLCRIYWKALVNSSMAIELPEATAIKTITMMKVGDENFLASSQAFDTLTVVESLGSYTGTAFISPSGHTSFLLFRVVKGCVKFR